MMPSDFATPLSMPDRAVDMITTTATPSVNSEPPAAGTRGNTPPRRKRSGHIRVVVWIVVGLLMLGLVGVTYQTVSTRKDQRMLAAPGQLVDVGTHHLHLDCSGHGSPAVILEAGNLGMSADWIKVQQQVAATTRVCSYDRAGMGWSETGPAPRDASSISAELHTLLIQAGVAAPYVLVGHSYGGLYTRRYAGQYPEDVAGLVLIDSSHPDQFTRSAEGRAMFRRTNRLGVFLPTLTRFGLVRLTNFLPAHPELPPQQHAEVQAFNSTTRQIETSVAEFRATPESSVQAAGTRSIGDLPLMVVTASEQTDEWLQMQDELLTLSPNKTHRVAAEADHASLMYSDRDAAVSSAAINQVVQAVRAHQPLRP
jgi:pimeloyl-ACP methyl ester carboxylesterase